jgi:hypothetical protein
VPTPAGPTTSAGADPDIDAVPACPSASSAHVRALAPEADVVGSPRTTTSVLLPSGPDPAGSSMLQGAASTRPWLALA